MSYKLMWSSKYGIEEIESGIESRSEAEYLQGEYRLAYGEGTITIQRE